MKFSLTSAQHLFSKHDSNDSIFLLIATLGSLCLQSATLLSECTTNSSISPHLYAT
jgi:hypothetical protein